MKEKEFCTLLDMLSRHDKTKQLIPLLTKLCLTSLFASLVIKRTFVAPTGAALKKLESMSDSVAKEQIRRHLLRGVKGPSDIKTGDVLISSLNDQYEVTNKSGKNITLSAKGHKIDVSFSDENNNAAIYITEDLLPENMSAHMGKKSSKMTMKGKEEKKKKATKKKSKKSQKGGDNPLGDHLTTLGFNMSGGGYDTDSSSSSSSSSDDDNVQYGGYSQLSQMAEEIMMTILQHPSLGLRHRVMDDWQNAFSLNMYPMGHEHNFANRLYAALLVYLSENMPNFIEDYHSLLSSNSLGSLEILLQRWQSPMEFDPSRLFLSDSTLQGFMGSPYWLNDNVGLIDQGRSILRGFCSGFGEMGNCAYDSPNIWQQMVGQHQNNLMSLLNTQGQLPFKQAIVGVYKKLEGEPNRFDPGTEAIYRRVWGDQYGVPLLRNDLMRYMSGILNALPFNTYNQSMATMFGVPMNDTISMLLQDFGNNRFRMDDLMVSFVQNAPYGALFNSHLDIYPGGEADRRFALTGLFGVPQSQLLAQSGDLYVTTARSLPEYNPLMGQAYIVSPNEI